MTVGSASNFSHWVERWKFENGTTAPPPKVGCGLDRGLPGPVAQRLEPAAHNGLVAGSSPARPTLFFLYVLLFHTAFFRFPNETTNASGLVPILFAALRR
jgi:hypothetical protein